MIRLRKAEENINRKSTIQKKHIKIVLALLAMTLVILTLLIIFNIFGKENRFNYLGNSLKTYTNSSQQVNISDNLLKSELLKLLKEYSGLQMESKAAYDMEVDRLIIMTDPGYRKSSTDNTITVADLNKIKVLKIRNSFIRDIGDISNMLTRIEVLDLYNNELDFGRLNAFSLSELGIQNTIKYLNISENLIQVVDLESATEIMELNASHNKIEEYIPQYIGTRSKLKKVDLSHNNLNNVEEVYNQGITNPILDYLDLSYNNIEMFKEKEYINYKSFAKQVNFEKQQIYPKVMFGPNLGNNYVFLNGLSIGVNRQYHLNHPKLSRVEHNKYTPVNGGIEEITKINIAPERGDIQGEVSNISWEVTLFPTNQQSKDIIEMNNLEVKNIYKNIMLDKVNGMKYIYSNIFYERWKDLEELYRGEISYLERANNLSNKNLTDIGFLESAKEIKEIQASNNQIRNLQGLTLDKLEKIDLTNNKISSVGELSNSFNLKSIKIANNNIEDFSVLGNKNKLKEVAIGTQTIRKEITKRSVTLNLRDEKGRFVEVQHPQLMRFENTNIYYIVNKNDDQPIVLSATSGSNTIGSGQPIRWNITLVPVNYTATIEYRESGNQNRLLDTQTVRGLYGTAINTKTTLNIGEKVYAEYMAGGVPPRLIENGTYILYMRELQPEPTIAKTIVRKGQTLTPEMIKRNVTGIAGNFYISQVNSSIDKFNQNASNRIDEIQISVIYANGTSRRMNVQVEKTDKVNINVKYVNAELSNAALKTDANLEMTIDQKLNIGSTLSYENVEYRVRNYSQRPTVTNENGKTYTIEVEQALPTAPTRIDKKNIRIGQTFTLAGLRQNIIGLQRDAILEEVENSVRNFDVNMPGVRDVRIKIKYANGTSRTVNVPINVSDRMSVNLIYINREAGNLVVKRENAISVIHGQKVEIPNEFVYQEKEWVVVDKQEAEIVVIQDKDINIYIIERPAAPTFGEENDNILRIDIPRGSEITPERLIAEIRKGGMNSNITSAKLKEKTPENPEGTRRVEITYSNGTKREIILNIQERDTVENTVRYNISGRKVLEEKVLNSIGQKINIPSKIVGTDSKKYVVQNYASRENATNDESAIYEIEVLEEENKLNYQLKNGVTRLRIKKGQTIDLDNIFDGVQNGNGTIITDETTSDIDLTTPGEKTLKIRVKKTGKESILLDVPIIVEENVVITLLYKDLEKENAVVERKQIFKTYGDNITLENILIKEDKQYYITDKSSLPVRVINDAQVEILVKEIPKFIGNTKKVNNSETESLNAYDLEVKLVNGEMLTIDKLIKEIKKDGANLNVVNAEMLPESKVKLIYSNGTERIITIKKNEVVKPREEDYVPIENIVLEKGDIIDVNKLFEGKISGDGENTISFEKIDTNEVGRKILNVKVTSKDGESISYQIPITVVGEKEVTVTAEYIENGEKKEIVLDPKIMNIGEKLMLDEILTINGRKFRIAEYGDRPVVTNNKEKKYKIVLKEQISAAIIQPIEPEGTKAIEIPDFNIKLGESLDILKEIRKVAGNDVVVEDVTEPRIDINNPGKHIAKIRVTYPGGGSKIISVPIYVSDKIDVKLAMKLEDGRILKQIDKELIIGKKITKEELVDILPEGYMIGNVEDKLVTSENGQKLSVNIVKISKVDIKGKVDLPYNFPEDKELLVELYKDGQKTGKFVKVSSRNPYYEFKNLDETDKYGRKITYTIGIENLKNIEEAGYEAKISETGEIYVLKITNKKIAGKAENDGKLKGKGEKENQSNQRLPYAGINGSDIVKLTVGGLVLVGMGYLVKVYVRR